MPSRRPDHVAVVGGGMVGLATAWYLQEQDVAVTLLERDRITPGPTWGGAGSSWGSAGWLTPGLATPLPEPAVLRYGLRMLLRPDSPVYLPPVADPELARFVAGFVRNSTRTRWRAAMSALVPLARRSLNAFDELTDGGVATPTRAAAPFFACYRDGVDRDALLAELDDIRACGQPVEAETIDPHTARHAAPMLSEDVRYVVQLHGQRFCDPGRFVAALADAVRERGAVIREGVEVRRILDIGSQVLLNVSDRVLDPTDSDGIPPDARRVDTQRSSAHRSRAQRSDTGRFDGGRYDAVVVATGAWLTRLTRRFGVRMPIVAGRGYSFAVPVKEPPTGPLYFPASRVAVTPLGEHLRIAGMMEFRRPDARPDPRRIDAVVAAARGLLRGVDLDDREQEWVGPRPCTPDGLPLIGPTGSPRVYAAGGHGMWGIALGPVTGQLLARTIVSGMTPYQLAPFDPLRPAW